MVEVRGFDEALRVAEDDLGALFGAAGAFSLRPEGMNSAETAIQRSKQALLCGFVLMKFGTSQVPTNATANSIWPARSPLLIFAEPILSFSATPRMTAKAVFTFILAIFAFKYCNSITLFVKASVNFFAINPHVLMKLFQLSGNTFYCHGQANHGLA
jgi:hypothetical protein